MPSLAGLVNIASDDLCLLMNSDLASHTNKEHGCRMLTSWGFS